MPSKKLENSAFNSALGIPTALKVGIYVACGTAVALGHRKDGCKLQRDLWLALLIE